MSPKMDIDRRRRSRRLRGLIRLPGLMVVGVLVGLSTLVTWNLSGSQDPSHLRSDGASVDPRFQEIDSYVRAQMDGSSIPGVGIAVVEHGEAVHLKGFGNDGNGQLIRPGTPFWIGSNTKSFTALAIMQLAERGELEVDAPVQRYLPEFAVADASASSRITIRHLLNQTSGFSRDDGIAVAMAERNRTLEEAVEDLRDIELNRPVGDSFEYSNLNFVVLGLVVERIGGVSWATYVEKNILEPVGMKRTFTSLEEARRHDLTEMHRYWFGLPVEAEVRYSEGLAPTGYLYSTAEDMAKYLGVYLNEGAWEGSRILSASGVARMLSPETDRTTRPLLGHAFDLRYGRGWFVGPFGAARDARWHLGDREMFNAWMVLVPDSELGVVVLSNANSFFEIAGANAVMSRLPIGIVNILLGEDPPGGRGLDAFYVGFDTLVLFLLTLQVWTLVRVARRRDGGRRARSPNPSAFSGPRSVRSLIPLIWEVGLAGAILVGWPLVTGMTWEASLLAIPDLSLVLLVMSALWIMTGGLRVARFVGWVDSSRVPIRSVSDSAHT